MDDQEINQQSRRYKRASDWYIPFSLVATVIGILVGVNTLLAPVFTAILDVNVKLTRLESQITRIELLERKVDRIQQEQCKKISSVNLTPK